jgi:hypothetical protein
MPTEAETKRYETQIITMALMIATNYLTLSDRGYPDREAFTLAIDNSARIGELEEATVFMVSAAVNQLARSEAEYARAIRDYWNARWPHAPRDDNGLAEPFKRRTSNGYAFITSPWSLFVARHRAMN